MIADFPAVRLMQWLSGSPSCCGTHWGMDARGMDLMCGYDNGMCAQQQAVAVACSSQTTCITCLQTTAGSCGWCASSGTCMNGDSVGPSTGTCAGTTWWTTQCQADEPSLVLTTPSSLKAGTTNRLSWTGGQSSSGQVKISIRAFGSSIVSKLSGLIGSVANTGSFSWTLTPGLPSAYYQLFIASASDPTNFALSNSFYIDGTVDTFVWAAGYGFFCGTVYSGPFGPTTIGCDSNSGTGYQECCRRQGLTCDDGCTGKAKWVELPSGRGACSAACGGGRQTRNFQCLGYYDPGCGGTPTQCAQPVTCYDFQCSGPYPGGPSTLYECNTQPCTSYTWSACNTEPCVETQLHLSAVQAVQMVPAGSAFNLTWSGGLQYGRVSASLQQVAVGVAGQLLANTTWQDAGLGLPVDVENTLSSRWAVPATLASGQYLLKLTSSATPANQDVMATPVVVQGTVGYELTLLPVGLGAALGSAATLQ
ncbi:A disintegrin and metalloproteinase with thrombospondin motifs 13, partial [Haematococcus lacustris]